MLRMLYSFFWVIPRRLNFIFRRFGTPCSILIHCLVHTPSEDGTDSAPKRRHRKFRRRGITQKKTYNTQNKAKVWNQESLKYVPQAWQACSLDGRSCTMFARNYGKAFSIHLGYRTCRLRTPVLVLSRLEGGFGTPSQCTTKFVENQHTGFRTEPPV